MADIVIINPSPNMALIASELSACGRRVDLVSVPFLPVISPKRVFYFFAGSYVCFTEDFFEETKEDDRIFMFKRGLISRFRMRGVSKTLTAINPDLSGGSFTDLIMLRRGMLTCASHNNAIKEFSSVEDVGSAYPDAKIVASAVLGSGNLKLCRFETDYDLAETFGNDYFVFLGSGTRMEAFCHNGELLTISKEKNHIDQLAKTIPTIKKFSFKQTDEKNLLKNPAPWIINNRSPKVSVINDYSFFGASISMPPSWHVRIAAALSPEKKK